MIKSWSVSKILLYEGCPRKFKSIHHSKKKQPSNPAMVRGETIHKKAEGFLTGRIRGLPNELSKLASHFRNLKKKKPLTELRIAVDKKWKITDWKKGWCRGVFDVIDREDDEAIVIDHKTGKVYEKHKSQAEVYACLASSTIEEAENFHIEFWYTDKGLTKEWDFRLNNIKSLKKKWTKKANQMMTATRFPATPNPFDCNYCSERSDKRGGTCHGWKKI
jgi:CRISPR/Cas system-associated exonuclease Cas4 (RecB family)